MEEINVRLFKLGDEKQILKLIHSARRQTNIRDYNKSLIEVLCTEINEELIIERAKNFICM